MPKEAHTKAAEHHENAAKSHKAAAEHHGKGEHEKGREESGKDQTHSNNRQSNLRSKQRGRLKATAPIPRCIVALHLAGVSSARTNRICRGTRTAQLGPSFRHL